MKLHGFSAEASDRSATTRWRPADVPNRPVTVDAAGSGRILSYLLVLAIEELLEHVNQATTRDDEDRRAELGPDAR